MVAMTTVVNPMGHQFPVWLTRLICDLKYDFMSDLNLYIIILVFFPKNKCVILASLYKPVPYIQ